VAKSSGPLIIELGAAALLLMGGKKKKGSSSGGSSQNLFDYSRLLLEDITPEMADGMVRRAFGRDMLLGVVTDYSVPDRTDYVRQVLTWASSRRPDINFMLVDCRLGGVSGICEYPWEWAFGPAVVGSPPIYEGVVDGNFGDKVKEIVER